MLTMLLLSLSLTDHKKTNKHTLKAFTMAYISEVPLTPPHFFGQHKRPTHTAILLE